MLRSAIDEGQINKTWQKKKASLIQFHQSAHFCMQKQINGVLSQSKLCTEYKCDSLLRLAHN